MNNRMYYYPDYQRYVLFTVPALMHMYGYSQRWVWQKEAGGELYTIEPNNRGMVVSCAAGPNKEDVRRRCYFNPDPIATSKVREEQFELGMHAIGLWHTHPESNPCPSGHDYQATVDYLQAFQNDRERYLMLVMGNCGREPSMRVWSIDGVDMDTSVELVESR